jgi:hypothetical protein
VGSEYPLANACLSCKNGHHDECEQFWTEPELEACCCGEAYDARAHIAFIRWGGNDDDTPKPPKDKAAPVGDRPPAELLSGWGTAELLPNGQRRGDSGYLHPHTMASKDEIYAVDAERTAGGRKDWTDDGPNWTGLDGDE